MEEDINKGSSPPRREDARGDSDFDNPYVYSIPPEKEPFKPAEDPVDKLIREQDYYWCPDGDVYVRKDGAGGYQPLNDRNMQRELAAQRVSRRCAKGATQSDAEKVIDRIQHARAVDFVGPLCGRPAGYRVDPGSGLRLLCPTGYRLIEPSAEEESCEDLIAFLRDFFGADRDETFEDQWEFFLGWLKTGRQAIRDYPVYIPGQAVAFIGPVGCGKTFLQTDIITPALGGRAVDPSDILINKGAFNAAMWAGEHLVLGDEELRENWAGHGSLMPTIKKLVAAKLWPFKKKYGAEIASLRPVWRLTVSANDDPRSLRVVPAPEESFGEKIAYLKAYSPPREFHDGSPEGRAVWAARLAAAIPAFLRRVDAFEIPEHKRDTRFAIETFHHPEIVELVGRNMPESAFGEALTDWITNVLDVLEVRGSAAELHRRVCRDVPSFSGLCKNPHTFGVNLGSLARAAKWKDCVKKTTRRVGGREKNLEETVWTISVAGKTAEAAAADGEPKEENDNPF